MHVAELGEAAARRASLADRRSHNLQRIDGNGHLKSRLWMLIVLCLLGCSGADPVSHDLDGATNKSGAKASDEEKRLSTNDNAFAVDRGIVEQVEARVEELSGKIAYDDDGRILGIEIPESSATDEDVALFAQCKNLQSLSLHSAFLENDALLHAATLPRLTKLAIRFANITDEGLVHLQHSKDLELLDLRGCVQISDAGLVHVAGLTNLRVLLLQTPAVTDEGVVQLTSLKKLEALSLEHCAVTEKGLDIVAQFPRLRDLSLMENQILEDAHLKPLGALTGLTDLSLRWTPIDGSGMTHLTSLNELERLNLAQTSAGDVALESIRDCDKMQWLSLWQTAVTDDGLKNLVQMQKLRHLDLKNTSTSDVGLQHVSQLENLEHLDLQQTFVSDAGLAHLDKIPKLQHLDLTVTVVTPEGVERLQAALPDCNIVWQ